MTETARKQLSWILLASLILSIPSLWVPYYKVDELTNAIFARFLNTGQMSLKDFLGNTYFLTHYIYAFIYKFIPHNTLLPVHAIYAVWKIFTVAAFFWTGTQFKDEKTGIWAALFYTTASVSFMSKDFHTPAAEAWAVLPAVLAAGFLIQGIKKETLFPFIFSGFFTAMATLFKAPMGITCVAAGILILLDFRKRWVGGVVFLFSFAFGFLLPAFFHSSVSEGIALSLANFYQKPQGYITSYQQNTLAYWGSKFFIRSLLISIACFGTTVFVFHGFRNLFLARPSQKKEWEKIFFLCSWFVFLLYVVTLGKRIFYYYYLFLLPPGCLLAALSLAHFDENLCIGAADKKTYPYKVVKWVRRHMALVLAIPTIGFSVEGAFNFSTIKMMPSDFRQIIDYVKNTTEPYDKIYVWGYVPQIYFYSGRLPASTYFWSDTLAGSSPGSPAMEYLRATGQSPSLGQKIITDLNPKPFQGNNATDNKMNGLANVSEFELFTVDELLNKIEAPNWKKVFSDILKNPPVLIIDTSPTNYRGFGHYPISKYELLKRFVLDNYAEEAVVENMIVYRLKP